MRTAEAGITAETVGSMTPVLRESGLLALHFFSAKPDQPRTARISRTIQCIHRLIRVFRDIRGYSLLLRD